MQYSYAPTMLEHTDVLNQYQRYLTPTEKIVRDFPSITIASIVMSVIELVFLGTGSAYPSPHRGASCMVLRSSEVGCWMFDCGEGSQVQLMRSSLRPGKLNKIFITHLHGDHLFGLPGLLCTISQNSPSERPPLEIYGPVGLRQYLRVALNLSRSQLGFCYIVHELHHDARPGEIDGMTDWCPDYSAAGEVHPQELSGKTIHQNEHGYWDICQEGSMRVSAATLKHRVLSFGYVISEDPLPGKLLVDKLKSLGLPPGPLYSKLKQGEAITTPEGLHVSPADVLGPSRPGRKIVILGDTSDSSDMAPFAMDADVLVHEATNENSHEQKCKLNGHSTPAMAASFCLQVGARQLILTHFSQRYKCAGDVLGQGDESVEKLVTEARTALGDAPISVSAAEDFKMYCIPAK